MSKGLLTQFLNQTCSIEKFDSAYDDVHADNRFLPPVLAKCRRESYFREFESSTGTMVRSQARYFLDFDTPVEAWKDKIDGRVVIDVQDYPWLDGSVIGYEVVV